MMRPKKQLGYKLIVVIIVSVNVALVQYGSSHQSKRAIVSSRLLKLIRGSSSTAEQEPQSLLFKLQPKGDGPSVELLDALAKERQEIRQLFEEERNLEATAKRVDPLLRRMLPLAKESVNQMEYCEFVAYLMKVRTILATLEPADYSKALGQAKELVEFSLQKLDSEEQHEARILQRMVTEDLKENLEQEVDSLRRILTMDPNQGSAKEKVSKLAKGLLSSFPVDQLDGLDAASRLKLENVYEEISLLT